MPYSEQKKEWSKQYYLKNKEKIAKQNKEWALKNKDKVAESKKKTKQKYKEQYAKYDSEYKKEYLKTETGKKNRTITNWKSRGIVFDNKEEAEFYYETYFKSTNCNWCDKKYKSSQDRALDHCWDCGRPRAIICNSCNRYDLVPCVLCLNS